MNKFEIVMVAIGKGVAYPFVHTAQFCALMVDALKDAPDVKAATVQLVEDGEKIVSDAGLDIVSKGVNFVQDEQTVADVVAFFEYFKNSFLPVVEKTYKQLKADSTTKTPSAPAA